MANKVIHKRMLSNIILFISIIIISFVIRFNPATNSNDQSQLISQLNKDDINSITIKLPYQENIEIILQNNHWYIQYPFFIEANNNRIDSILNILNARGYLVESVTNVDLSELKLSPAKASITFNETTMLFGDIDPIDNQRYTVIDDAIFLLDDMVYPIIRPGINNLISLNIIPNQATITEIQLNELIINKNPENEWQTNSNNQLQNKTALQTWINNWLQARAANVRISAKRADFNNQKISIQFSNQPPITYTVIDNGRQKLLYRPDYKLLYQLHRDTLATLLSKPGIQLNTQS